MLLLSGATLLKCQGNDVMDRQETSYFGYTMASQPGLVLIVVIMPKEGGDA